MNKRQMNWNEKAKSRKENRFLIGSLSTKYIE